jgi:competence transcription factor ComK
MTEREIKKILLITRNLDKSLRYWIFKEYIKDCKDLDFLKAEIEYEIEKRSKNNDQKRT